MDNVDIDQGKLFQTIALAVEDATKEVLENKQADRITELEAENAELKAFREAVVGWRENDWPEYFCKRTAEMVADRGREVEDTSMNERKTGWHKLNYHERGERITELEQDVKRLREEVRELSQPIPSAVARVMAEAEVGKRLNRLVERLNRIRPQRRLKGFAPDAFISGQNSGWNLCLEKVEAAIAAAQKETPDEG